MDNNRNLQIQLPIMGISKLRVNTDGPGIRTLVLSTGCPLHCRYCINNQCHEYRDEQVKKVTVDELYSQIKSHRMYFWASGGGVNFGGGEPLLYEEFIVSFARKYGNEMNVGIETSLNVPITKMQELMERIQLFIVDVKEMNPEIYQKYTGVNNNYLMQNLEILRTVESKVIIRIPQIPGYNSVYDQEESIRKIRDMGFRNINLFPYITDIHELRRKS